MGRRIKRSLAFLYRHGVRPLLPKTDPVLYAGMAIGARRVLGDDRLPRYLIPSRAFDVPDYEFALASALRDIVVAGDVVIVVGAGQGVTAALAAYLSKTGAVTCFEGDPKQARAARTTALANGLRNMTVVEAIVGEARGVYGRSPTETILAPRDLPPCDILEMDCEGSELGIIDAMTIRPRAVVVETHGFLGAPTPAVREALERRGYRVSDRGLAEPRFRAACEQNDIRVLVGLRAP